jgi:hypothetical protein
MRAWLLAFAIAVTSSLPRRRAASLKGVFTAVFADFGEQYGGGLAAEIPVALPATP